MIAKPSAVIFLVIAIFLLFYIIWKERQIRQSFPLWIRISAAVISILALVFLFYPIAYTHTVKEDEAKVLPIFTKGTALKKIDSVQQKQGGYTTDPALARSKQLAFIDDWPSFVKIHAKAHFAIYGNGLTQEQLDALRNYTGTYYENPAPSGIVVAHWEQQLEAGSDLHVQGLYHNTSDGKVRLYLVSASKKVDSVEIKANQLDTFRLSFQPRQLGSSLFELIAQVKEDTLQREKIPVMITEPRALHVLLLAASPSFEYKFLYNWLRDMRYQVVSRQRISKDKYLFSNLGSTSTAFTAITAELLEDNELLIADEEELGRLNIAEQQIVLKAVQKGMGLILFGGEGNGQSLAGRLFKWRSPIPSGDRKIHVSSYQDQFPELAVNDLASLADEEAQQAQFFEGHAIIAGTKAYGRGKITALTLHQSYAWWLSGQEKTYTKFWSLLTSVSLPQKFQKMSYVQSPAFPSIGHWSKLTLLQTDAPTLKLAGKVYPLISDQWIPAIRMLSFWSEKEGWNQIIGKEDTLSLYTYGERDWSVAKGYSLIKANKSFFMLNNIKENVENGKIKQVIYLPKWILFAIFFVSVGTLWYSSKNYN